MLCDGWVPKVEDGEAAHEAGLEGEEARDEAELVTMEDAGLAVLKDRYIQFPIQSINQHIAVFSLFYFTNTVL
jgi:hypothetical protein